MGGRGMGAHGADSGCGWGLDGVLWRCRHSRHKSRCVVMWAWHVQIETHERMEEAAAGVPQAMRQKWRPELQIFSWVLVLGLPGLVGMIKDLHSM